MRKQGKRLIINADDLGFCDGVSRGIVEAMTNGAVQSASIMACDAFGLESAANRLPRDERRIGVHLQLTDGVPLADPSRVPSLLARGTLTFPRRRSGIVSPRYEEVVLEWSQQVDRAMALGVRPSHIDTHHDVHLLPAVFDAYCEIALRYSLPARTMTSRLTHQLRSRQVRCADFCEPSWGSRPISAASLVDIVNARFTYLRGQGTVEFACHPGYVDAELECRSRYVSEREQELNVFCDPVLPSLLANHDIALIRRAECRDAEWS